MLISIILPVFNAEKYLSQCIESLLQQNYAKIEIVAVNDGSTDRSGEILNKMARLDMRLKVYHQKNSGPATARNLGLSKINGQYLMFCDADDWYEPEMCEEMIKKIITLKVDLVMCSSFIHEEIHNKMSKNQRQYSKNTYLGFLEVNDELRMGLNVLLWNKIFRVSLIREYEILFPDGYEHDDFAFFHQYINIANNYFGIANELYHHRLRENSIMDNFYKCKSAQKKLDLIQAIHYTGLFLKKHGLWEIRQVYFLNVLSSSLLYVWQFLQYNEKQQAMYMVHDFLFHIKQDMNKESRWLKWIFCEKYQYARWYLNVIEFIYGKSGMLIDLLLPRGSNRRIFFKKWL